MKSMWKIREAIPQDSDQLQQCMESAYATYMQRMGDKRLPPMDVDYEIEINNYPSWVVESTQGLLGGLIMVFENNQASIANIAVDPAAQGQGIGKALMNFAESQAKQRHFSELHLATHVLLQENITLYEHLGWQQTGRDETRVYMQKKISLANKNNG